MVAPGAAGASFDVLLQFSLDEEAQKRIESRTSTIADELKRIQTEAKDAGKAINEGFKDGTEAVKKTEEAVKKTGETVRETTRKINLEIRNLRSQARAIISEVRLIRDQAEDLDRVFKPLAIGGALITGGIFAAANKYVQDATEATQVTREWKAAQADLERSGQQIGAVLAQEALPLLRQAAQISRQVAGIIERNPEIVKATLYGGMLALAVGTIGKLYTSGLRLYADIKLDKAMLLQQTAAQLQLTASENQLRAAGLQAQASGAKGVTAATGGGLSSSLNSPLGLVGLAAGLLSANVAILKQIDNLRDGLNERAQGLGDVVREKILPIFNLLPGLSLVSGLGNLEDALASLKKDAPEASKGVDQLSQSIKFLGGSRETQDAIVQAFSSWKQEDARIVNDAMQARKQIIADGERSIVDITRNYTSQRAGIERQYSQEAAQITARYQAETQKAEQDYINERAQIERDGNDRINEIRAEEQEKREEIERNFAKAVAKAGAERDALALVQAQETRDEALAEAERGTQETIARERQETQQRLQELAARYAQERQQRQAQYEADLKENALRRAQALKEAAERYQAELKQAREATAQKLQEAQEAANRERAERRQQFIAQLGDLGVTLNSERQLRVNAYNAMLSDVSVWLNQMRASFANAAQTTSTTSSSTTGGTTGVHNPGFPGQYHDYSGYAFKGIYRMAQNGKPEWVMSGNDTKAAERAIGGQLTQANMAQMFATFAALRGSMQVIDNTTYGKDMTTRQIRDLKEIQARSLDKLLGGY